MAKGPHATPLALGDKVITVGGTAIVSAWNAQTGALAWRKDYSASVDLSKLFTGTAASPLNEGGLIIVQVGSDVHGGRVVALDPSLGMLSHAAKRGVRRRVRAVAETLPFPDERFHLLSMGYALRHVVDLRATFQEYRRVLKPGGRVLLLEITPPSSRLAHRLLSFYMGRIAPLIARFGRGGKGSREMMEYYWDTIETCVPPATILQALAEAGFSSPKRYVEHGILSEYTAVR
jgi:demethylmenaquinone methyltransferase/2-methoxy-6-polyprenyl-1,4-benzoquinol methylase